MYYKVSARKYRPLSFDTVVGQATLTTTLRNAIKNEKLAHAYLFCGPRGVGKTTCARIFARAINCFNPVDGDACGECESCKTMGENRSFKIFELVAASNNSVEDIKSLMEQTRIPPQVGRYKVFIIDEVHMLSTAAFNAFLKTLEEPPAHVIFILATTEKHKLLPTIISRCQIYDFERMSTTNTINHLKMVAEKEGYEYEDEALTVIAEKADGGMRDALSIFDQVASYTQGKLTYAKVIEDLNVLDSENYFKIVDLALENKVRDIMILVNSILSKGFDGGNLCQGLAGHVRNVMLAKDPSTMSLLETSTRHKERLVAQAQRCPDKFLYTALKVLNNCDINYKQSSNKRLLCEITLIQVAQITQEDDSVPAGLRPNQLKTIFRLLAGVQKPEAPQVAKPEETQKVEVIKPEPKPETKPEPIKVATKKRGLGLFSTLNETKTETEEVEEAQVEDTKVFDQPDLDLAWRSMCLRMAQNKALQGISLRLKNVHPVLKNYPHVEIIPENSLLYDELRGIEKRILNTLRKDLNNSEITLTIGDVLQTEFKPAPTKREILEKIKRSNPAIGLLLGNFDLELS